MYFRHAVNVYKMSKSPHTNQGPVTLTTNMPISAEPPDVAHNLAGEIRCMVNSIWTPGYHCYMLLPTVTTKLDTQVYKISLHVVAQSQLHEDGDCL